MNEQVNRPENTSAWLGRYHDEFAHDPDFVAEGLAIHFTSEISRLMVEQGVSRSSLAEALGVSRAYVTKIFSAPPNLTLKSMVSVAMPLEAEIKVDVVPKRGAVRVAANEIEYPIMTAADTVTQVLVEPPRERPRILFFPTATAAHEMPIEGAPQLAIA